MTWSEQGMASVYQQRPHCVYQMGKTHSKPLAAWHGRGTAWARHTMCESAFSSLNVLIQGRHFQVIYIVEIKDMGKTRSGSGKAISITYCEGLYV